MSIIQAGILGVAGVLLAVQFKGGKAEYGIYSWPFSSREGKQNTGSISVWP